MINKIKEDVELILNKEETAGGITIPKFSLHCREIVIKNSRVLAQKQISDLQNSTDTDLDPPIYEHLILYKETRSTQ